MTTFGDTANAGADGPPRLKSAPWPSEPHILLVDDERDIRDPLAAYLSRNGVRVTKAENAAAARQLLSAYAIDLVLLDIMMPGEDGLSLAGFIRATTTTSRSSC